jgi:hypothetical protein
MLRIAAVVVLAVLVGGIIFVVSRPTRETVATMDPDVRIVCDGSTSVSDQTCRAWGDEILALGPPSTTFEMQDLASLVITKPLLGIGSPCQAAYFLGRYPDDAAWDEDVPCRDG